MIGHAHVVAYADRLAIASCLPEVSTVATPIFDFSHLSPDERIQLAEDLWNSLPDRRPTLTDSQCGELTRRAALRTAEPTRGRPWRTVLDEVEQRAQ